MCAGHNTLRLLLLLLKHSVDVPNTTLTFKKRLNCRFTLDQLRMSFLYEVIHSRLPALSFVLHLIFWRIIKSIQMTLNQNILLNILGIPLNFTILILPSGYQKSLDLPILSNFPWAHKESIIVSMRQTKMTLRIHIYKDVKYIQINVIYESMQSVQKERHKNIL